MKSPRKIVTALVSAAALLVPAAAHAHVTRVWYDALNEPANFNRQSFLQTVQSALREYEYHGRGQIALKWEGVTSNKPGGGVDDLIFGWNPALVGTSTCAETWTYTFAQLAPMGRVNMNPAIMGSNGVYTALPVTNNGCVVGKAVLQHEMAHWFRQNTYHFANSVLGSTCASGGYCTDYLALHLWNEDMDGINQNDYGVNMPKFPPLGVSLATDFYNHGNGSIQGSSATLLSGGGPQNFTGALGLGGPQAAYTRGFTDNGSVTVEQGDGQTWSNRRTFAENTRRQMCVTGAPSTNDMIAVWASEQQIGTSATSTAGARYVRYSESHDGGNTWSSPASIPNALTRTGVSCAFDVQRNRFVAAWSNAATFQVLTTDRFPVSQGALAWSTPVAIAGPLTYELPMIQFDPFTAGTGMLTWHGIGNASDAVRSAVFFDNVTARYKLVTTFGQTVAASAAESADLRTNAVPNPFSTETHFAYGRNSGPPSTQIRVRRGSTFAGEATDSATETSTSEPPIDRYVGAANHRFQFASAYLRQIIFPH